MAQDINFDITGDIKNLKKNLGKSKSLIRNFNKFNDRSSKNRVRFEKRASDNISQFVQNIIDVAHLYTKHNCYYNAVVVHTFQRMTFH